MKSWVFLTRLDSRGDTVWTKTYGKGEGFTIVRSGTVLPDGGMVLVGGKDSEEDVDIYFLRSGPEELSVAPVVEGEPIHLSYSYRLGPCHPNPFNTKLVVPFYLEEKGEVHIRIYSSTGRSVREFSGEFPAGEHRWVWDGKDEESQVVASGVYTVRMEAGRFRASEKVVLVR